MKSVRFVHPSGTFKVGVKAGQVDGEWIVNKASMSCWAGVLYGRLDSGMWGGVLGRGVADKNTIGTNVESPAR